MKAAPIKTKGEYQVKIITLQGIANSGKSTALKMLYFLLLDNGAKLIAFPEGEKIQSREKFQNELSAVSHRVSDIALVVEYKGMRIGIFSAGDSPSIIRTGIWFFEFYHCDIGFNASHLIQTHINCIKAFQSQYGYACDCIPITIFNNPPLPNSKRTAEKLFKMI